VFIKLNELNIEGGSFGIEERPPLAADAEAIFHRLITGD
jgi:hypothetical protein